VDVDHGLIAKTIKEEVSNSRLKEFIGKIICKEKANNECKCNLKLFFGAIDQSTKRRMYTIKKL
jgi:hypothetical protein